MSLFGQDAEDSDKTFSLLGSLYNAILIPICVCSEGVSRRAIITIQNSWSTPCHYHCHMLVTTPLISSFQYSNRYKKQHKKLHRKKKHKQEQ